MVSETMPKKVYDVSASTTPLSTGYALDFVVGAVEELKVYLTDSKGDTLVDSANYTVTSDTEGVVATLVTFSTTYTFPEGTKKLTLTREVEVVQEINLVEGMKISAETLEEGLDDNCRISLMLAEQLKRAPKMSISTDEEAPTFPDSTDRAGKMLAFDENGDFSPVLTSDVEQKLAEALEAEEATLSFKKSIESLANEVYLKAIEINKDAESASASKDAAAASASSAAQSATTATEKETSVNAIYAQAVEVQTKVAGYESTFDTMYSKMQTEATRAETGATQATASAESANKSATNAETSEKNAKSSETNAAQSAIDANQSYVNAKVYAEDAAESASAAQNSADSVKGAEATTKSYMESASASASSAAEDASTAKEYGAKAIEGVERLEGSLTGAVDNARQTVQGYIEEADESESRITALRTQLQTLVDKVESLSAQTVTETIIVDGSKVYKKSVTIKNGRPYCTLTEVTE